MNDRDALMRAIRANPDEDTPRLMLADWYEENGERERAEFMRCQIGPKSPKASARASELFHKGERWRQWIPPQFWPGAVRFERGLIAYVGCECSKFYDHAADVFREGAVYEVRLYDREADADMGDYIFVKAVNWPQRFQTWRDSPYYLPPAMMALLEKLEPSGHIARYPNRKAAQIDLNRAALAYGRAKIAKLAELEGTVLA